MPPSMLLQAMPWVGQNPLIPLLILFGAGLGVGLAASLVSGLGTVDVPTIDGRDDRSVADATDSRWEERQSDE